ncbi:acetylcholinesterase-1 [Trichonephila inaurata madagascariensis]|uniref:Carboxylic ester hydrolase n=1 Tax=Trichonephila inaurata madagascariensis TaxID=2747483 RepID=A0A8X6WQ86_9ARAC|nr:acetylcholinesterase-1 [Trichonephila inaurata madagascariensis]
MRGRKLLVLLWCFSGITVLADRIIETTNGLIQGVKVASGDLEVEAFLSIPYAEPPVGDMRFQKPVPKTSWAGVYDATKLPPSCFQNATGNFYWEPNVENMTEDCLYLNIWVPYSSKSNKLKPIVFYIHGGAFNVGSGNQKLFDGAKLAQFGDIIVANLNYRLGPFGLFSAFIEEANGNMAIYDQILALKWLWNNAKSFGGDPDHIVLQGESAGAMCISNHLVSSMSKGMIKRAILQSGSATIPLILDNNAKLYADSQTFSSKVGCANESFTLKDNPKAIVQCLKSLPPEVLAAGEGFLKRTNPLTFIPRVGDEYLPRPFTHQLKDGNFKDVEMLMGVNKLEGAFFVSISAPQYFGTYGNGGVRVSKAFAHQTMSLMFTFLGQRSPRKIADFYIKPIKNGNSEKYVHAVSLGLGDCLIDCGVIFHAEYYSLRNPVYFYVLDRRPSSTPVAEWMKTSHYDELQYVFGNPLFANFTPEEERFSQRVMARWVAFIKTGNPNIPDEINWPVFTRDAPKYLVLKDKEEVVLKRHDDNRCEFWRERFQA